MSVMRCDKHDRHWDSDVGEQCPQCASEPQAEPQPVSVPYELPAHAEPQPAPTPNPGPIGSSLGVAAPDVAALVKRFGERARGANDNAQRGGDADAQAWSIVAQDYRDARAMLTAQQARIDALASSRDAAVRLWNEAGEEIEALKHDNGRMVERETRWVNVEAERDQLREAMKGATAIANSAGATIRTLTKERDRAREALRDTLAWLDDPRMDTWPYMENGPFHDDRRVHQDKLRAALAEGK